MKKVVNILKSVAMSVAGVGMAAAPAFADGWTPTFTIDTAPVFTVAGLIVTAIGAIWCIKKVIKLGNRS